jgi:hypothetical protein
MDALREMIFPVGFDLSFFTHLVHDSLHARWSGPGRKGTYARDGEACAISMNALFA